MCLFVIVGTAAKECIPTLNCPYSCAEWSSKIFATFWRIFQWNYHCSKIKKKITKNHASTINVTMFYPSFIHCNKNKYYFLFLRICSFISFLHTYHYLKLRQLMLIIFKSKLLGKNRHEHVLIFKYIFSNSVPFTIRTMLCQKWITYINLKTFVEYLRKLELAKSDRQTNQMNKQFYLCCRPLRNNFQTIKLFQIGVKIFHYFSVTLYNFFKL